MRIVPLGLAGIPVSEVCCGTLTVGPLQKRLSVSEGAKVIRAALEAGINFMDTAELYDTYSYIREALRGWPKEVVIASKSYAYNAEGMKQSIEKARREMNLDVIDIFLLHEQESRLTMAGHRQALEYLLEAKAKGIIRAVGVSTHAIEVVEACALRPEIDIIHPIINKTGLGIRDGGIDRMLKAVEYAHASGKGIYAMKAFGGGNLLKDYRDAFNFVHSLPFVHSIAVGFGRAQEVEQLVALLEGELPKHFIPDYEKKCLHIEEWCGACGECTAHCPNGALSLREEGIVVEHERCLLCSYCSAFCPQFAIRVY